MMLISKFVCGFATAVTAIKQRIRATAAADIKQRI